MFIKATITDREFHLNSDDIMAAINKTSGALTASKGELAWSETVQWVEHEVCAGGLGFTEVQREQTFTESHDRIINCVDAYLRKNFRVRGKIEFGAASDDAGLIVRCGL